VLCLAAAPPACSNIIYYIHTSSLNLDLRAGLSLILLLFTNLCLLANIFTAISFILEITAVIGRFKVLRLLISNFIISLFWLFLLIELKKYISNFLINVLVLFKDSARFEILICRSGYIIKCFIISFVFIIVFTVFNTLI
jgi:hypothetical protein